LGGVSNQTLWRVQRYDERFPRPGRLRGKTRIWDEDQGDHYIELVTSNSR